MGQGVDAVKDEIMSDFGSLDVVEGYDSNTMSTTLGFAAEGRHFVVRVSEEFDQDYGSRQVKVDLKQLGQVLRASKDGKATVRRSGISS
jgi:hypothetical protein